MTVLSRNRLTTVAVGDVYTEVQRACEKHLAACAEALYASEEAATDAEHEAVEWPDTNGPYCGCDTCVVREVLHAARPFFARLAAAEAQVGPVQG